MTTIEDRLTAVLEARADQVQPEDLRPAEFPGTIGKTLHRPATYLLAAAAVAVALAVPFLDPGGSDPAPPPATQTPRPGDTTEPDEGADWHPVRTRQVDVDGDGIADEVQMLQDRHGHPGEIRVEVEPSAGEGPTWVQLYEPDIALRLLGVDLDDDGGQEIVVTEYLGDHALRIIDLVDGSLQPVEQPADEPLTDAFTREGRVQYWWVDLGGLFSTRSLDVLAESDHYVPLPEEYPVQMWRWDIANGVLRPTELDVGCAQAETPEQVFPC